MRDYLFYLRKLLLPILLMLDPKLGLAQQNPNPMDDSQVPYLVVFTTGLDTGDDLRLKQYVQQPTDAILREIVAASRVRVIDAKKPGSVYARYKEALPPERLPAIAFTQGDGGVLYVADKNALPQNESSLAREIQYFVDAAENAIRLTTPNWPNSNRGEISYSPQDCPDGICPVPTVPNDSGAEQRRPLFPRLRNSSESQRNIMDNWFSTNYQGISPITMIVILALFVLVFFARSNNGNS